MGVQYLAYTSCAMQWRIQGGTGHAPLPLAASQYNAHQFKADSTATATLYLQKRKQAAATQLRPSSEEEITGNSSSFRHSKDAKLCLKCTKIRLAAGLRPDPLGEL